MGLEVWAADVAMVNDAVGPGGNPSPMRGIPSNSEMLPAEQGCEAGEIGVGGHPLTAAFDRQRCVDGVRHELSFDLTGRAQIAKNAPMIRAGAND